MSIETNPYQAPETRSEPIVVQTHRAWWRWVVGITLMVIGAPIFLYGLVICGLVIRADFSTPPISPYLILACGLLITGLGISVGCIGFGVIKMSWKWSSSGLLGSGFCVISYVALAMAAI